jgi:hypothetical protein
MKKALTIAFLLASITVYAQAPAPKLTDIQKLTVERHALAVQLAEARAKLAEAEARLATCTLSQERAVIESDLAEAGIKIDWSTLNVVSSQ